MDIAFTDLKEKEIINILDGKKMGRIIDFLFDIETGQVKGVVVPGERKLFKKNEDIFVPLERIRKIGGDVILVKLKLQETDNLYPVSKVENSFQSRYNLKNYYERQRLNETSKVSFAKNNQTTVRYNSATNVIGRGKNTNLQELKNNQTKAVSFVRFKPINNIKYK